MGPIRPHPLLRNLKGPRLLRSRLAGRSSSGWSPRRREPAPGRPTPGMEPGHPLPWLAALRGRPGGRWGSALWSVPPPAGRSRDRLARGHSLRYAGKPLSTSPLGPWTTASSSSVSGERAISSPSRPLSPLLSPCEPLESTPPVRGRSLSAPPFWSSSGSWGPSPLPGPSAVGYRRRCPVRGNHHRRCGDGRCLSRRRGRDRRSLRIRCESTAVAEGKGTAVASAIGFRAVHPR